MSTVYLLGHPIGHSISPAIHTAAYRAMGLDLAYHKADVTPEQLQTVLIGLQTWEFTGANLTIPHKQAIIPLLDRLEEAAQAAGAVNCIRPEGQQLAGTNTDGAGWLASWREEIGEEIHGRRVLLLGAGGAARGLAAVLPGCVTFNRQTLPHWVEHLVDDAVVVNCTPVGMRSHPGKIVEWPERVPPGVVACDLVYNPRDTEFLRDARARGLRTLGGLGMLLHQAALCIHWWTGQQAPLEVMRAAAEEALPE